MGITYGQSIASGGNQFYRYIDNGYVYFVHVFYSDSHFSLCKDSIDIDYLIVGGGGGASIGNSGGGGGGGVLTGSATITRNSFPVIVGLGGAPHPTDPTWSLGSKGGNSSFLSLTALGGGCGAVYTTQPTSGSSGGGAAHSCCGLFRAPGTAGQGYAGGFGAWSYAYGGGGGAGGAGQDGSSIKAGDGGIGIVSSITGSSVYYGGGGAGGTNTYGNVVTPGLGGFGGGGNSGARGTNGLGGGAGGRSGYGGSGVVIVRYRILLPI